MYFQVSVLADDILKNVEYDALRIVFNKFHSVVQFLPTVSTVLSPEVLHLLNNVLYWLRFVQSSNIKSWQDSRLVVALYVERPEGTYLFCNIKIWCYAFCLFQCCVWSNAILDVDCWERVRIWRKAWGTRFLWDWRWRDKIRNSSESGWVPVFLCEYSFWNLLLSKDCHPNPTTKNLTCIECQVFFWWLVYILYKFSMLFYLKILYGGWRTPPTTLILWGLLCCTTSTWNFVLIEAYYWLYLYSDFLFLLMLFDLEMLCWNLF